MTPASSDEVVRHVREVREEQIRECSRRAAKKIVAKFKAGWENSHSRWSSFRGLGHRQAFDRRSREDYRGRISGTEPIGT